jgi:protein required for attachment to host cells
MQTPRCLILLVSAHEVKLLRQDGHGGEIAEVAHLTGRHLHDGNGAHEGYHAVDPRHAGQEKERSRVVAHAIDALHREWAGGSHDRIILSAPDKLLGMLRKAMPKDLARHVSTEFDKDLIHIPAHDMAGHLGASIRF